MVKKAQALPFATPSVKRRSRDQRPVGRASRVISSNGADLRSGTSHPGLRECAALRGEAAERKSWRKRSRRRVRPVPSEPSFATEGCSRFLKEGNPRSRVSFTSGSRPGLYPPTSVRRRTWLARTLSTQAQAGGEKHNADRGDNPARARIGSSGFVPVGQYVLQKSVGSRSSEKRLVHPSSEACAGVGEGYAKRGEFRDGQAARPVHR